MSIATAAAESLEDCCTLGLCAVDEPAPDDLADPLDALDLIPLHNWNVRDERGRDRGKSPRDGGWREATYSREELRDWRASGGNLGVRLGAADLVLDYDPRNDPGGDSLERFCADVGLDYFEAGCPVTLTGGGGLHVFLRKPLGVQIKNELREEYPGLEFKTLGRQVVAPGSRHPNGNTYRWALRGDAPEAPEAPAALVAKIAKPERAASTGDGGDMTPERVAQLLSHLDPADFAEYEEWLRVGMACHHATGGSAEGLEAWTDWSLRDARGDTPEACRAKWESFDPNQSGGVSGATLCYEVEKVLGYVPHPPAAEDFEEVEDVEPVEERAPEASGPRLLTMREFLAAVKPAPPIVDGFLYGSGVFVLFGKWGLGKTYLALDLALHVAHGLPEWHGRKLHLSGRVAYLALEGEYAIPNRLHAWHAHHRRDADAADLRLFAGSMNLTRPEARERALRMLIEARPGLIFVDTLSAAMAGADENAAGEVGEVLEWCRRVVRETGAPVVLIHHPGKGDPNSARGSSTIEANTDGVLQLSRPEKSPDGMALRASKVRSSAPGHVLHLRLQSVELPGGGSDAVPVLAAIGDERARRLQALAEATTGASGRLGAQQAAEVVSRASSGALDVGSAAKWIRRTLKDPESFYLLALEKGGTVVRTGEPQEGDS